jgi:hypothetical protein
VYWTRVVGSWLYGQIDGIVKAKIFAMPDSPLYADELYDAILDKIRGSHTVQNGNLEIAGYLDLKRSDFASAHDYIQDFERQYNSLSAQPHLGRFSYLHLGI